MKFLLFCYTGLYTDCKIFAEVLIYANVRNGVQMFSQISCIPDLIRKFWAKRCGLYAGVYSIWKVKFVERRFSITIPRAFVFHCSLVNKYHLLLSNRTSVLPTFKLTYWLLHQTVRDPPQISWCFVKYFRASESTKINHMHSNNRHKIRFQDFVYSKFNKCMAKY